jgi:hypothetical protein
MARKRVADASQPTPLVPGSQLLLTHFGGLGCLVLGECLSFWRR